MGGLCTRTIMKNKFFSPRKMRGIYYNIVTELRSDLKQISADYNDGWMTYVMMMSAVVRATDGIVRIIDTYSEDEAKPYLYEKLDEIVKRYIK